MATLQSFYPWVSVDCPGVPSPLLDDAIRRGAREFCKETHAIEYESSLVTVGNTQDYNPTLQAGTELISVKQIRYDATTYLTARKREELERMSSSAGDPQFFSVLETRPLSLRLHPTPSGVKTYSARYAVMPTITATEVDDKLFHWYLEGVTSYAKYWLMIQPGKDWTNAEQAAFEWNRFMAKVSDAKVQRGQWMADLPNTVQMNPFA